MPNLPDSERCMQTDAAGRRCRSHRMEGDHSVCFFHWSIAERRKPVAPPALVEEILSPTEPLDSATAVNTALTRIFRLVAAGRMRSRDASALAYLGQLIITTLPHMQRELAHVEKHALLGVNPDAAIADLAQTLQNFVSDPRHFTPSFVPPACPEPAERGGRASSQPGFDAKDTAEVEP